MKKIVLSIVVLIISILTVNSQNNAEAEKLINNLLLAANKSAVRTNFSLKVSDKNKVTLQSGTGTFTLKGAKFVLEMSGTKAWFDGKTQWAYVDETNEVSITEPTEQELAEINPMAILLRYKLKSKISFAKSTSLENHIIELKPLNPKDNFKLISVQLNKSTNQLVSIRVAEKNGNVTYLGIKNYQSGLKVSDSIFKFNAGKYKGVTVNDLR